MRHQQEEEMRPLRTLRIISDRSEHRSNINTLRKRLEERKSKVEHRDMFLRTAMYSGM